MMRAQNAHCLEPNMLRRLRVCSLTISLLLVAACGKQEPSPAEPPASEAAKPPAATSAKPESEVATDGQTPAPDAGFSIDRIPVSTVTLGDFPYIQLPAGYSSSPSFTRVNPFDRVGFWTGEEIHWVEGKFHIAPIASDAGAYSPLQVERNIAAIVEQAGGVRVFSGEIPSEISDQIREGMSSRPSLYRYGSCFPFEPVHIYVIRRSDRAIWIQQCSNGDKGGGWIIGETEAFEATAALLPSSEIQQALGEHGRIALQVNFASDQAVVLEESMPQVEEIASLLEADDALRLAIEGHTDDTGAPERNRELARARAQAVVDLVIARGIDAGRLEAAGYGADRPVADNTSEDGRAANRRVELVSL